MRSEPSPAPSRRPDSTPVPHRPSSSGRRCKVQGWDRRSWRFLSRIWQWHRYIRSNIMLNAATQSIRAGKRADIGLLHGVTKPRVDTKEQIMDYVKFGKTGL